MQTPIERSNVTVSVVIPAYNVADYIVEALDSLLKQSVQPEQIIVIDDGSTDTTATLIRTTYGHEPRVQLHTIGNGGAGNARNLGIGLATGDFIFCMDPDDIVVDGLFNALKQAWREHGPFELFCFSSSQFKDIPGRPESPKVQHASEGPVEAIEVLASTMRRGQYTSAAWTYMVSRALITQHAMRFEGRVHEDHRYTAQAFLFSTRAFTTPTVYYKQRMRAGSLTMTRKDVGYFRDRYDASIDTLRLLEANLSNPVLVEQIRRDYLTLSFDSMVKLSIENGTPVPSFIRQGMAQLGGGYRQTRKQRLLFGHTALYVSLIKLKRMLARWRQPAAR